MLLRFFGKLTESRICRPDSKQGHLQLLLLRAGFVVELEGHGSPEGGCGRISLFNQCILMNWLFLNGRFLFDMRDRTSGCLRDPSTWNSVGGILLSVALMTTDLGDALLLPRGDVLEGDDFFLKLPTLKAG